jgi:uncharacterized lipoprotein YmbA
MMRVAFAIPAVLALASCGSSPQAHYYTLNVATGAPLRRASVSSPVQIAAVHMAETLDRREMVSATGPNSLKISDEDRWSAPLGVMTRRVLSQDLAVLLPPGMVVLPDAPAPATTARIVVTIAQFGLQANGKIVLVGDWSLLKGRTDTPVLRRDVSLQANPGGAGASAQAAGMSELLAQLAGRIAATLSATH